MRRLLTGVVEVPGQLVGSLVQGWNRFWFTPADPTALGMVRVLTGGLLFWSLLVYGLELPAFFGRQGWANLETILQFRREREGLSWSFWFFVPDALLRPVWVGCLLVLGAFTLGLGSRVTAVLAWAIAVSTARRVPISLYGFDTVVGTWALYLAATGASGQAVSLDRLIQRWRTNRAEVATRRKDGRWTAPSGVPTPTVSANLGLRLIQSHLVLIYCLSGLSKLRGGPWWDGTAIWGTIAAGEFRLFDLTWLAAYPFLLNAMTHGAVMLEVSYPALVWVRPVRPLVITAAMLMHAGIGLTLGLFEFGLAMIAGNLAFASGPWLRSLVTGLDQPSGRVLYDGNCPLCRRSMAVLTALDADRVLEPVDLNAVDLATIHHGLTREECLKAIHLVRRDGVVEVGYAAMMRMIGWTPLGVVPALSRFVPGVSWVGRRVYNRVAASRPRDGSCSDEVCGIHPPGGSRVVPDRAHSAQPPKARR